MKKRFVKVISTLIATVLVTQFLFTNISLAYEGEKISQEPRVGLAISSAGATALLTLATYSGITFLDSESMDEFIYRFIGLEQTGELLKILGELGLYMVDGTLKLGSNVVDSIQGMFNKIAYTKDAKYTIINNQRILTADSAHTSKQIMNIIQNTPYEQLFYANPAQDAVKEKVVLIDDRNYAYVPYISNSAPVVLLKCNSATASSDDKCTFASVGSSRYAIYGIPVLIGGKIGSYLYYTYDGRPSEGSYLTCSRHSSKHTASSVKELNTQIGTAWTSGKGTIPRDDEGGVSISIPSNMGDLIGKEYSDVATPSYPTWTPGKDITIPSIDSPSVEYVPDTSNPPDTENPPGTDTENPPIEGTVTPPFEIPTVGDFNFDFSSIDFSPLMKGFDSFTKKFPFSLPWDFKRCIDLLDSTAKKYRNEIERSSEMAPVFEIDILGETLVLDFSPFIPLFGIVKIFVGLAYFVCLMLLTKKLLH